MPLPFLLSVLLFAAPPEWVKDPGTASRLFPPATHVTGYGVSQGRGMGAARAMARAELASALRVRVRADIQSATLSTTTTQGGKTWAEGRRFEQNLVQTQAEMDLEGLDRMETWTDPATGAVHVLAVLERGKAASLLESRQTGWAGEARAEYRRAVAAKDFDGLLRTRNLLKRIQEATAISRVVAGRLPAALDLPSQGEVDAAARALLAARPGLDGALDGALYALGADLPSGLRAMVDRIVFGQTRFSGTFGAYLEQRLAERLMKFDGIRILDKALASQPGAPVQAQALLHGSYLEVGDEVSLLLKATSLSGEELASSQVRVRQAAIRKLGLRLLPENHEAAAQSLAILDTEVAPSELKVNLQLDRGDGGIYRKGDQLHLFLKASRDCHVRVVYQQVDGTRVQVFPNHYHPEGRLKAGVATRIPAEGDGFVFNVAEPFGAEIIQVFASTEPFELAPQGQAEGPFMRLETSLQAMTRAFRGIRVEKAKALTAQATAVVNTVDVR